MISVVGLGANLGDRLGSLRDAAKRLEDVGRIVSRSQVYETEPVGAPPPSYLNAAVLLDTASALEPEALMKQLLAIEAAMGRKRKERNEPRVIDLDILWIQGVTISTEALVVPHPRLTDRAFALGPLLDVAPDAVDPATNRRYADVTLARGELRLFAHL